MVTRMGWKYNQRNPSNIPALSVQGTPLCVKTAHLETVDESNEATDEAAELRSWSGLRTPSSSLVCCQCRHVLLDLAAQPSVV